MIHFNRSNYYAKIHFFRFRTTDVEDRQTPSLKTILGILIFDDDERQTDQ